MMMVDMVMIIVRYMLIVIDNRLHLEISYIFNNCGLFDSSQFYGNVIDAMKCYWGYEVLSML